MSNKKFEAAFQRDLTDWFNGGPSKTGWTRTGPIIIPSCDASLAKMTHEDIDVDLALAKNRAEVEKWHISFLRDQTSSSPKTGTEETLYWKEYLSPRYNRTESHQRVNKLLKMFQHMKENGYSRKFPVWVADVRPLSLGFDYFRFNGCHRIVCAKVLGIKTVPACLFSIDVKIPGAEQIFV